MSSNFVLQGPLLLQDTPLPDTTSGNSNNLASFDPDHCSNNNILPMIEEPDELATDGTIVLHGIPPDKTLSRDALANGMSINNHQESVNDINTVAVTSVATQSSSSGVSNYRNLLIWKHQDTRSDDSRSTIRDLVEVAADGNKRLSNQLYEERIRVDLLAVQMHQMQREQGENAQRASGIYDEVPSQLQAVVHTINSDVKITEVAQVLDVASPATHLVQHAQAFQVVQPRSVQVEALQDSQNGSQIFTETSAKQDPALRPRHNYEQRLQWVLNERKRHFSQELEEQLQQEHQNVSAEIEARIQEWLQELEHGQEQSHHLQVHQMEEECQQQAAESIRAHEELVNRIKELKQVQARESQDREQRFQQELEERLQLQHQELSAQTAAQIEQQLLEREHDHEQSHQAQLSRLEEERREEIAEFSRTHEEFLSRI
ncbi:hypothetical protein H2248_008570 [Termitomyces sp. 'cryptogamus']|nr:hypothetical protein H2248_008570 [Termitomyces sp. 'cryptogamus']